MSDNYYSEHADAYDASVIGVPGDIEFYRSLAVEDGGPVVELGVGTGRLAIPVAQAGVEVIGIDIEPAMLAIAGRKVEAAGVAGRVRLVEGDMRSFRLDEPVGLVTIPFRAFLHNLTVEDQRATLEACFRALRPGGRLALNVFNPDVRYIASWLGRREDDYRPDLRSQGHEVHHDYLPTSQVVHTRMRMRDAAGRRRDVQFRLRYVYRYEMQHLLERAGFEVEAVYGDFEGSPLDETSTEMVWVARRPA